MTQFILRPPDEDQYKQYLEKQRSQSPRKGHGRREKKRLPSHLVGMEAVFYGKYL